jgi:hypothetical protein
LSVDHNDILLEGVRIQLVEHMAGLDLDSVIKELQVGNFIREELLTTI